MCRPAIGFAGVVLSLPSVAASPAVIVGGAASECDLCAVRSVEITYQSRLSACRRAAPRTTSTSHILLSPPLTGSPLFTTSSSTYSSVSTGKLAMVPSRRVVTAVRPALASRTIRSCPASSQPPTDRQARSQCTSAAAKPSARFSRSSVINVSAHRAVRLHVPALSTSSRSFSTSPSRSAKVVKPFRLADIGEGISEVEIVKWYALPLCDFTAPLQAHRH